MGEKKDVCGQLRWRLRRSTIPVLSVRWRSISRISFLLSAVAATVAWLAGFSVSESARYHFCWATEAAPSTAVLLAEGPAEVGLAGSLPGVPAATIFPTSIRPQANRTRRLGDAGTATKEQPAEGTPPQTESSNFISTTIQQVVDGAVRAYDSLKAQLSNLQLEPWQIILTVGGALLLLLSIMCCCVCCLCRTCCPCLK